MSMKRTAGAVFLSAMLLSNVSLAYGQSSQPFKIDPSFINTKTIETSQNIQSNIQSLPLPMLKKSNTLPYENPNDVVERTNKIFFNSDEEFTKAENENKTTIPVEVVAEDNQPTIQLNEKKFENQLSVLFKSELKFKKVSNRTYHMDVTKEQLDILKEMKELKFAIIQPKKEKGSYIADTAGEQPITPFLNAASEMTGVTKARSDFKVTGALDGMETTYTKSDVVIAVVDTGIDANHVDLDGGKVIGWYDSVNDKTKPYDDHGHGTHVASIVAGTGEGDPNVQTGVAPGAALVGVKVLDSSGHGSNADIIEGLQWLYNNLHSYNVKAVNFSIGTLNSYEDTSNVITWIKKIENAGVPVFVAAGNSGHGYNGTEFLGKYYDTLSTYAKYTSTSVASIKDPYEGGWGLSVFSSRGTGSTGPFISAPGESIRAAKANSRNEYVTMSGTSMATPFVAGTYALMYDAAYSRGTSSSISFSIFDMGTQGYDKLYGNGILFAYESIKNAAQAQGDFDNHRALISVPGGHVAKDYVDVYAIKQNATSADLNATLLIINENKENLDLAIWEPGADPYQGAPATYYIGENTELPQENINIKTPKQGTYYFGVFGKDHSADYTLEITGNNITP